MNKETKILAEITDNLRQDYNHTVDLWENSSFKWIRIESSKRKGAIGEKIVERWLRDEGFGVTRSPDSDADRIVNGHRAEIKMSTLWETGVYKFQQLRNQNYEFAICLGISPDDVHCWVIPKSDILRLCKDGSIGSQHNGQRGTETYWFLVNPNNVPTWLSPFGGSLSESVKHISNLTKGQ